MALGTSIRHLLREAVIWSAVTGAGFSAVYFLDDIRAMVSRTAELVVTAAENTAAPGTRQRNSSEGFERSVTLQADRSGHFAVEARINGRRASLLADTGATLVMLTYEDARNAGFSDAELRYTARSRTANGVARVARVRLDRVEVGDIMVRDVEALVAEPGKLHINLLGMSFIGKLTRFELRGRELVLIQ